MVEEIIQIGAEAIIIKKGKYIIKRRVKKSYRSPEFDERIRKLRTRSEARLFRRASEIIDVPKIIKVDELKKEIVLEFIDGKKLSENLDKFSVKKQIEVCKLIGRAVAKLHASNIIHGDLTTSNMILVEQPVLKVFFIDFGLGFISHRIEDKAVDIHLFRQALEAKHFRRWNYFFKSFLEGYKDYSEHKKVFEHLIKVEQRGRYKERY
ncbi:MAG: KEOPS complex kinase/ATPase Bud32 [Candidatus Pacearchaeota archaeon]